MLETMTILCDIEEFFGDGGICISTYGPGRDVSHLLIVIVVTG